MKTIQVSVAGCSLADFLYADIDFNAPAFRKCASRRDGDGGLQPGKLVFADSLEKHMSEPYAGILPTVMTAAKATAADFLLFMIASQNFRFI